MTLSCVIDPTGISAPDYPTILAAVQAGYQGIFGSDAYFEPDSQDGQLLAIFSAALSDTNAAIIAAYNAFSPATAQGNGLSRMVKINGLTRAVPTNSQVLQEIVGTVGATISNGYVLDTNNVAWNLPASVVVPAAGSITVTATCSQLGAIAAPTGSITAIGTPTIGWLSTTNTSPATLGAPYEFDGALRQRQAVSTAIPSQTVLEGLTGAVTGLSGVTQVATYENDASVPDTNGLPAHSIAVVVDGGDAATIAATIAAKKAPGCTTVGSVAETVTDTYGIPRTIRFYTPSQVPIAVAITIQALPGYTTATGAAIQAAVQTAIDALPIGSPVYVGRLYNAANLPSSTAAATFDVLSIQIGRGGAPGAPGNVAIAFNEVATCPVTPVLTVTT